MAIELNPKILNGKPIIRGTRISVELVLELLSSGMEVDSILQEYPHLTRENVFEAITFAAKSLKHEEIHQIKTVIAA